MSLGKKATQRSSDLKINFGGVGLMNGNQTVSFETIQLFSLF